MRRKRLLWQILSINLLILALSLIALTWIAYDLLHHWRHDQVITSLRSESELLKISITDPLYQGDYATVKSRTNDAATQSANVFSIILPDGRVLADSDADPELLERQSGRPEFVSASEGNFGLDTRFSTRFGREMIFGAIPILHEKKLLGVIRIAAPSEFQSTASTGTVWKAGLVVVIIGAIALAAARRVALRIVEPLQETELSAQRIAHGDFGGRITIDEGSELSGISEALNSIAEQLSGRSKAAQLQNLEQQAIVSSMLEGVLVIDMDHRLINLNAAASRLLGLAPRESLGRSILEIVRNNDLQRLISKTFVVGEPVEGDVTLVDSANGERFLQAHGTLRRDSNGEKIGALIVLNDITRLRKLENLRRDFVANVSHELKTPITSIKGFVETLIDDSAMSSAEAKRFLEIIARQADRLHAIIEDLLKLSRIEQDSERGEITLELTKLRGVLAESISACAPHAAAKEISVQLECDERLQALINPPLIEQAVVNLIENAIKYSPPNTKVLVSAIERDKVVSISVSDQGPGIAKEHIPRLFERFYTVDKARSRAQGGTGLGLAIVKHIVLAHGGNISVSSEPDKGSTFLIMLARA